MSSVGVLSPLPPSRSGVADYTAALLRAMAARADVTAYTEGPADPIPGVRMRRATRRDLRRLDGHDLVLAQMGNSDLHAWILDVVRSRPTVVVLHDVVLHHLVAGVTLGRDDPDGYIAAMGEQAGRVGRMLGYGVATKMVPPIWEVAPSAYPLTGTALTRATGVVVHSRFAAERVRAIRPGLPVRIIPLLTPPATAHVAETLPGDPFPVVGCFGFVIRAKRLDVVVRSFGELLETHPRARLLVVGESPPALDPARMARDAGLPENAVTIVGYADRARYESLVRAADIGVSLRHPTMGESSAAVAHLLSVGVPTVVSTGGWYDELPASTVVRVPPDEREGALLTTALRGLASDGALRARLADSGRRYAAEALSPEAAADAYLRFGLAPLAAAAIRQDLLAALGRGIEAVAPAAAREAAGLSADVSRAGRSLGIL